MSPTHSSKYWREQRHLQAAALFLNATAPANGMGIREDIERPG